MGYRRALLVRWSRRDRLAVLVVALAVAFLVGTTLVVLGAGAQTAAIAAAFGSSGQVALYDSPDAARATAGPGDLVLPFAEATTGDGHPAIVLARPAGDGLAAGFGSAGDGVTHGASSEASTVDLVGRDGTVSVEVSPRGRDTMAPPSWYVASVGTVAELGPTGALVVSPGSNAGSTGTPLRAALEFFLRGTREVLAALTVAGLGAAVLVGVTVYGVTLMGVRDRLETVRIVRATGGTPRTVLGLFAVKAGLLTAVGATLGYALGVILPNAAVSVAIASGQTVSLPLTVTSRVAVALVPAVVGPVLVGIAAGGVAAYPAATRAPARIDDRRTPPSKAEREPDVRSRGARLHPRLLERRLVVPTAATLAAFVVFATVAAGLGTALGPVAAADTSTVVEPGAPHPIASQVPDAYADALAAEGIDASGEILLLEVVDGRPFVAVGADFDRYAAVHGATLTDGRVPSAEHEALVGASLAAALDVDVGDRLVLGGSTREGVAVVTVVGRFAASGPAAGQLVVSLPTARHLSGVRPGFVHLVSAERLPASTGEAGSAVGVVDVSVPDRVAANEPFDVRVALRNDGLEAGEHPVRVRYGDQLVERTVELGPLATRTVTVELLAGEPATRTVRVDGLARAVRVVPADAIAIAGLPAASPPDGRPLLQVVTLAGTPVANATVAVGDRTWRTDSDGLARPEFEAVGPVSVTAIAGERTASRTVDVSPDARRDLDVSMAVEPSNPSVLVRPTARLSLRNPWAVPIERTLVLESGGTGYRETVRLEPGERRTLAVPLERRAPGSYALTLAADGRPVVETSYAVTGDDRLAAALASSGRTGGTGLTRAIEAALGNLRLVVAVVVGLAGLLSVGATAATFAAGVQARRRTLGVHRATGASPTRVLRLVLADALRLGTVSTVIGLVVGLAAVAAFAELGVLTVLGIAVSPVPPLEVTAAIAAAALGLTLLGAGLATWSALSGSPGALLRVTPVSTRGTEAGDD